MSRENEVNLAMGGSPAHEAALPPAPGAIHSPFINRELLITRDRIEAIFLGIAIGDALGFPVETRSAREIAAKYGRLTDYVEALPNSHGPGQAAGLCTDDFQLTKAVANAIISSGTIDLAAIARAHVEALKESTLGWGGSTREAVQRLEQGVSYLDAGRTDRPGRGVGNGVVMKLAPIALAVALGKLTEEQALPLIAGLTCMTHRTNVAIASAFAHVGVMLECLRCGGMQEADLLASASRLAARADQYLPPDESSIKFCDRLERMSSLKHAPADDLERELGGGSSNVYDSVPFTYAYLLKRPDSIEALYDLVNGGGDTDSNAAMAGAMLGAMHGKAIFPSHLLAGLGVREQAFELAGRFCEKFQVPRDS